MAQPRFEFRLEALLEHRKRAEKEQQRRVAVIQQEAGTLVRQIQDAQAQIAEQNSSLAREKLLGALDLQFIAHEKRFVGTLHMKIALTMQKLAAVDIRLNAARAELLKAAKARKVIEKLREKQQKRWLEELERKDAAAMDEIGTQVAIRQMHAEAAAAGE